MNNKIKLCVGNQIIIPTSERIHLWEEEIARLEEYLKQLNISEYCSVFSYFEYHKQVGTFDQAVRDEILDWGFVSLGNSLGLAWIRQGYLPRLKANHFLN